VAAAQDPMSATEVAKLLGVDKSTVYRMLVTLMDAGYVLRDDASKRYKLSYKIVSLSRNLLAGNEMSGLIRKTMRSISRQTGETVHLSVLEGHETTIISKVKGEQILSVDFQIGDHAPLHCTSIGKALLAFQDVRLVEQVIAKGLPKVARKTITNPIEFRKELQRIRSQGFAYDDAEMADDMRCVAVPIFESAGVDKGISMSGPISRFSHERLVELKNSLLEHVWKLSEELGGIPGAL
jgi:DNA-binding IclR family transcriptional regulator